MTPKEELELIEKAIKNYRGFVPTLEGAIGTYFIGKEVGWKVVYLVHEKRTLRKYEQILGIDFREVLPEVGHLAKKSIAWTAVQKVSNFWKAVKGEIPGIRSPELR